MGGVSAESQISLQSGKCIAEALRQNGMDVVEAVVGADNDLAILDDASIDVFFLAFHGEFGEGGQMQKICEQRSLVYTGSGSEASELAFDKMGCKRAFADCGLAVPKAIAVNSQTDWQKLPRQLTDIADKFVVKPIKQGSSIGVKIVDDCQTAAVEAKNCLNEFGDCMVEEFIQGREITVGIVGCEVLPVTEIRCTNNFYDYQAKYEAEDTKYLFDTIDNKALVEKINEASLKSFNALGCRDFGRVDFILTDDDTAYILEINTIPGFTTHSLLPKAAAKAGMDMAELCEKIVKNTLKTCAKSH